MCGLQPLLPPQVQCDFQPIDSATSPKSLCIDSGFGQCRGSQIPKCALDSTSLFNKLVF